MISIAEQRLSRSLRIAIADIPVGESVPETDAYREVLEALEYFIPTVIEERHREWKFEALDAVLPVEARKTGEGEIKLIGICILISDQTLAPLQLQLQVADFTDEISRLECKLGERGRDGIARKPYTDLHRLAKQLYRLDGTPNVIDWVYHLTFGERRV